MSMWFDQVVGELNNQVMINNTSNHVYHSFICVCFMCLFN